jgi:hypothetical protein
MAPEARQIASDKITALCCERRVIDGVVVYRLRGTNDIWDATPPDWFNDLNAMQSAEKVLDEAQQITYAKILTQVQFVQDGEITKRNAWNAINATASQRAEVFLRTLNLWVEN